MYKRQALNGYAFADAAAPCLAIGHATWETGLLLRALKGIDAQILKSGTDLEYLANFLEMEAARYVRTGDIQDALVALLRTCLPVSYTHLDVYKRQILLQSASTLGPYDSRTAACLWPVSGRPPLAA